MGSILIEPGFFPGTRAEQAKVYLLMENTTFVGSKNRMIRLWKKLWGTYSYNGRELLNRINITNNLSDKKHDEHKLLELLGMSDNEIEEIRKSWDENKDNLEFLAIGFSFQVKTNLDGWKEFSEHMYREFRKIDKIIYNRKYTTDVYDIPFNVVESITFDMKTGESLAYPDELKKVVSAMMVNGTDLLQRVLPFISDIETITTDNYGNETIHHDESQEIIVSTLESEWVSKYEDFTYGEAGSEDRQIVSSYDYYGRGEVDSSVTSIIDIWNYEIERRKARVTELGSNMIVAKDAEFKTVGIDYNQAILSKPKEVYEALGLVLKVYWKVDEGNFFVSFFSGLFSGLVSAVAGVIGIIKKIPGLGDLYVLERKIIAKVLNVDYERVEEWEVQIITAIVIAVIIFLTGGTGASGAGAFFAGESTSALSIISAASLVAGAVYSGDKIYKGRKNSERIKNRREIRKKQREEEDERLKGQGNMSAKNFKKRKKISDVRRNNWHSQSIFELEKRKNKERKKQWQ